MNLCTQNIFSTKNVSSELKNASFLNIINSEKLNDNRNIIKIRRHLKSIYSIMDYIGLEKKELNKIIDSNISNDIFNKAVINVMEYFKTGDDRALFSINDLNMIIDDNIDNNLENNKINLNFIKKKILTKTLKAIGKNILNDIPNTSDSTSFLSDYKLLWIKIMYSDSSKDVIYILTIAFLLILIIINSKDNFFARLKNCFIFISILIWMTIINLNILASTYGKEWYFMINLMNNLNINLFVCSIILIFISCIIFIYYKRKRKV